MNSNWSYIPETPNSFQIGNFWPMWPWNLMDDIEKQQGTSPMPHEAMCIILLPYVNTNWSYGPETAKLGFVLCDLDLWSLNINGDNTWKFHDDKMKGILWEKCDGRTDRQIDRQDGRTDEPFIELLRHN